MAEHRIFQALGDPSRRAIFESLTLAVKDLTAPLIDWIAHHRAFWTERADRLERLLERMDR